MAILGAPVSLSAIYNLPQFFGLDGEPLAGGRIYSYQAASNSMKATTYCDNTGTIPNPNPIELDSSGRMSFPMWLNNQILYKFVLTDRYDNVIDSIDNVVPSAMQIAPTVGYSLEDFYGTLIGYTTSGVPEQNEILYSIAELDNSLGFAGWMSNLQSFGMTQQVTDPLNVTIGYIFHG